MKRLLLAAAILTSPMSAHADEYASFFTGGKLMQECTSDRPALCTAYIMGISDALEEGRSAIGKYTACTPRELTAGQTRAVVMGWYWKHPEMWKLNAARVVAKSLGELYPCVNS